MKFLSLQLYDEPVYFLTFRETLTYLRCVFRRGYWSLAKRLEGRDAH